MTTPTVPLVFTILLGTFLSNSLSEEWSRFRGAVGAGVSLSSKPPKIWRPSHDLGGMYLSDNDSNPRKWVIPDGTMIDANGYLIIWADEDSDQEGLHASFKLSSHGETITLVSSDISGNLLLDTLTYGELGEDVSYGRSTDGDIITELTPSPGTNN
ncbi:MAG: hypothetical protein ACI8T1_002097 [Verrucomicrobiales bacterium]|jgi:hypothetical protein